MRLTLRTLLAYLDDILEPNDAQDVGQKIEESEFASGLVHRIRDVARRLRLGAPKLDGRGMGMDPNTVAEYLDNTLPPERVADFEKVCLESDMHLAEVASCHQILALVLGEPADVAPESRLRMYKIAALPADGHPLEAEAATLTTTSPLRERAGKRRKKQRREKVPAYLREGGPKRRRWPVALLAVMALVASGVLVYGLLPGRFLRTALAPTKGSPGPTTNPGAGPTSVETPPATETPSPGEAVTASEHPTTPAGSATPSVNVDAGDEGSTTTPSPIDAVRADATSTTANTAEPSAEAPLPAPGDVARPSFEPETGIPGVNQPVTPLAGDREPAGEETPEESTSDGGPDDPLESAPSEPSDEGAGEASTVRRLDGGAPLAAEIPSDNELGMLVNDEGVLLQQRDDGTWVRVRAKQPVRTQTPLVALPTYRPTIALGGSLNLEMLGGTMATFLGPDPAGVPTLAMSNGRVVIVAVGGMPTRLRLKTVAWEGVIETGKDQVIVAIEVSRGFEDGTDPTTTDARETSRIILASGQVQISPVGGAALSLRSPAEYPLSPSRLDGPAALPGGGAAGASVDLPTWISREELPAITKQVSSLIEETLASERSVLLELKDLAANRKHEVRALAVYCLGYLDQFEDAPHLLEDPLQRSSWDNHAQYLRDAMARSRETAVLVKAAFDKARSQMGPDRFQMLRGFTDEELASGEAENLVAYLSHPDLDVRVLAIRNLTKIAGKDFGYKPESLSSATQRALKRWKQSLDAGEIVRKDQVK